MLFIIVLLLYFFAFLLYFCYFLIFIIIFFLKIEVSMVCDIYFDEEDEVVLKSSVEILAEEDATSKANRARDQWGNWQH